MAGCRSSCFGAILTHLKLDHVQNTGYGSLGERAAAEIWAAIVSGEPEPGAAIKDAELAAELGLSRTPVREALASWLMRVSSRANPIATPGSPR
ncbi:GntR family transcriptional regulator [Lentzea sp. NPDC051208]|uniref:GntR family transcriptional regulator n=1 Tax=Lentzea sp. NPDC051208 TaxID=3154642 RepID=UPI00343207E7